jgi:hypothetical protein
VRIAGAAVCAAVCAVAPAVAWLQDRPALDGADAVAFTAGALRAAGVAGATVAASAEAGFYRPAASTSPETAVWVTEATVAGGRLDVYVDRFAAQAIFVDERADSGGLLLTPHQFAMLDGYTHDPALGRRLRRNLAATVAGSIGAVVAVMLTVRFVKDK